MKQLLGILVFLLMAFGCSGPQKLSTSNLAYLYQNTQNALYFEAGVFHNNAVSSEIQFGLPSDQLLYTKKQSGGEFTAQVNIHYQVFHSFDDKVIVDSATVTVIDTNNEQLSKMIYGAIPLKIPYPGKYVVKLVVKDLNRNSATQKLILIDKTSFTTPECFRIEKADDRLPVIQPYFVDSTLLRIVYEFQDIEYVYVKHYNRSFELPPPPFSSTPRKAFDYTPDSTFSLTLSDSGVAELLSPSEGFYLVSTIPSAKTGKTLFHFSKGFPKIKSAEDLIEPLRYICSNKEYEQLTTAENPKKAVDQYWLSIASGSTELAKVLIKNYYHHVEESNQLFTSYLPGWKTDRGMIYIVFGSPDALYKDEYTETWVYGEENSPLSLTFNFIKVDNPFSNNDFRLTRSPMLKNPWYGAVEKWRRGKIVDEY